MEHARRIYFRLSLQEKVRIFRLCSQTGLSLQSLYYTLTRAILDHPEIVYSPDYLKTHIESIQHRDA